MSKRNQEGVQDAAGKRFSKTEVIIGVTAGAIILVAGGLLFLSQGADGWVWKMIGILIGGGMLGLGIVFLVWKAIKSLFGLFKK